MLITPDAKGIVHTKIIKWRVDLNDKYFDLHFTFQKKISSIVRHPEGETRFIYSSKLVF